jgi:hypothetical protein
MDTNTYTLLIWELIPEETHVYLIPNTVAENWRGELRNANHSFLNNDVETYGMSFLNAALCADRTCVDEGHKDVAGIFASYLQPKNWQLEDKLITHVYLSGFVL